MNKTLCKVGFVVDQFG